MDPKRLHLHMSRPDLYSRTRSLVLPTELNTEFEQHAKSIQMSVSDTIAILANAGLKDASRPLPSGKPQPKPKPRRRKGASS